VTEPWPGTPYWCDDNAAVYCGDNRVLLPVFGRRSCNLLVSDPPYGVEYVSNFVKNGGHGPIVGDDGSQDIPATLALATSTLPAGAHCYVFGFAPEQLSAMRLGGTAELIWDKTLTGMGDLASPWGTSHERITFGSYQPSTKARADGRGRLTARLRKGTVLRIQRTHGTATRRHPTEKPIELLSQLIESSSCRGDIVLDPFAGVGSTGVAAVLLGRRAVCVEIDEGYCAIAASRLRAASELLTKAVSL